MRDRIGKREQSLYIIARKINVKQTGECTIDHHRLQKDKACRESSEIGEPEFKCVMSIDIERC